MPRRGRLPGAVAQGRNATVSEDAGCEGFVFGACQFLALDADGRHTPRTLDLSVHGRVRYLPEAASPCGERFELRLDLDAMPPLPETSSFGHDVHLWAHSAQWRGYVEVCCTAWRSARRGAATAGRRWRGSAAVAHFTASRTYPYRPPLLLSLPGA